MKTTVVIPASGLGDALLMMIASHRLLQEGCQVITQQPRLNELHGWFKEGHLFATPDLTQADLIIAQNDNSARIQRLREYHRDRLAIFYPTYSSSKHGPLFPLDQVFDDNKSMAENIAISIANLLQSREVSRSNGLVPKGNLEHRKYKNRVLIHPTSSNIEKNWPKERYLQLAIALKARDYEVHFVLSPEERTFWESAEEEMPLFPTLEALASAVYESGYVIGNDSLIGHLASNLHIPTLIIANCPKRMKLWRPGWLAGNIITPPSYLPNWKFLRLKKRHWQRFISCNRVLSGFDDLEKKSAQE
jgi:heptosyltransferase-3